MMATERYQRATISHDRSARDLAWLAVADCIADGPVILGVVVSRIETAFVDTGAPFSVSAYLQEMAHSGRIRLVNDGRRWIVSATVDTAEAKDRRTPFLWISQWLERKRR